MPVVFKIAPGEGGVMPDLSALNLVALHKPLSPQYDGQCLKCHADIITQTTLNPNIYTAHQIMILAGIELGIDPIQGVRNRDCRICHAHVDFPPDGPSADIRKHVSVSLCAECHGPTGTPPYYQAGGGG